jgi:hypothetical protein
MQERNRINSILANATGAKNANHASLVNQSRGKVLRNGRDGLKAEEAQYSPEILSAIVRKQEYESDFVRKADTKQISSMLCYDLFLRLVHFFIWLD